MAITSNVLFAALPNLASTGTDYTGQPGSANGDHTDERPAKVTVLSDMKPVASTFASRDCSRGTVDWIGAINHNLDRRLGSFWRCWAVDRATLAGAAFTALEQLYPTSLDASTNLAGTYTAVDDDPWASASESDYLTATGAGDWAATLGFATPSATLSSVGNDHAFVLRVGDDGSASNTLTAKLYEGGSPVATLPILLDDETVGTFDYLGRKILVLPFSTSQLGTASGAAIQLRLEAGQKVRVYSALLVAGLDVGAGDSGWLAVAEPPESAAFGSVSAGLSGEEPTANEFHTFATAVDLVTAASPMVAASFLNATNAASPTNKLGVLAAGKFWQPTINPGYVSLAVQDASTKGRTLGGQNYGSNRRRRRVATVALEDITRSQMLELFERIDWRTGRLGAFFVCLFPDDTYGKRITGFWGTLGESEMTGAWEPYTASDANDTGSVIRWRRTYQIEEKL